MRKKWEWLHRETPVSFCMIGSVFLLRGLCISPGDFMGDSGRHCSCSGKDWKSMCNVLPALSHNSLHTSGRLIVASRGYVKYIYKIYIYVIYVCVWLYSAEGCREKGIGRRCLKRVHSLCIPVVSSIAQYASTYSSSKVGGVQISLASVSLLFII